MKSRRQIINGFKKLRDEIDQFFMDAEHWNNSTKGAIDPDPDGKLYAMKKSIDKMLTKEKAEVKP